MTDVLKVLTNIRSLRVIARDLALEQLESILEKIQLVVAEKKRRVIKSSTRRKMIVRNVLPNIKNC